MIVDVTEKDERLGLLWAKSARGTGRPVTAYRPLRYHLIDAACVAEVLWDKCIPIGRRRFFAERAGMSLDDLKRVAVVAAGLHDVGKCNPRFQFKHLESPRNLFGIPNCIREFKGENGEPNHAFASGLTAVHAKHDMGTMFADILRGHHGRYQQSYDSFPHWLDEVEPGWIEARHALAAEIFSIWGKPETQSLPPEVAIWLSGLVVACDWIASTVSVYPPENDFQSNTTVLDAERYLIKSRVLATRVTKEMGWLAVPGPVRDISFNEAFSNESGGLSPNLGQQAIFDALGDAKAPSITLVEYPTGYGKSEVALEVAARIGRAQDSPGMYFALPTRASSDPMYKRTRTWLERIHFNQGPLNLQLLHGTAAISKTLESMVVKKFNEDHGTIEESLFVAGGEDQDEGDCCEADGPMIAAWFGRSKRGMLAPYAVGTVDQLLIAGLSARHTPLRLFGLGCKSTIVVDEVHAYDRYMTEILKVVLGWLGRMGVSVVLLSATLTESLGRELVGSWLGRDVDDTLWADYPRFTHARMGECATVVNTHVPLESERTIAIQKHPSIESELGRREFCSIIPRLKSEGGRYVVICNTVRSAQELYTEIRNTGLLEESELELYHARLIERNRQAVHERIESRCAKNMPRDGLMVVIATQVLEASIDVDFDELWSEIAPFEALVQRAGRMHRHTANSRPPSAKTPTLNICGLERKGGFVPYPDYAVLRTIEILESRNQIAVPTDIAPLIEEVYKNRDEADAYLEETKNRLIGTNEKQKGGASIVTIEPPPRVGGKPFYSLFEIFNKANASDDPERSTRWDATGLRVIILNPQMGQGPYKVDDLVSNSLVVSSPFYIHELLNSYGDQSPLQLKIIGPAACLYGAIVLRCENGHVSLHRDTANATFEYDEALGLLASTKRVS